MGTTLPEVEVLPEFPCAQRCPCETAVGGGNDATHFDGAVAAHAFKLPFLQHRQELGLHRAKSR
jgi:hypothetical protein